jgi:hypothetical protein
LIDERLGLYFEEKLLPGLRGLVGKPVDPVDAEIDNAGSGSRVHGLLPFLHYNCSIRINPSTWYTSDMRVVQGGVSVWDQMISSIVSHWWVRNWLQ